MALKRCARLHRRCVKEPHCPLRIDIFLRRRFDSAREVQNGQKSQTPSFFMANLLLLKCLEKFDFLQQSIFLLQSSIDGKQELFRLGQGSSCVVLVGLER